jgi:hypothetical protein
MEQPVQTIVVDLKKLREYCLSASHPRGRHKARVFQSRLGVTQADAELPRQALLGAAQLHHRDLRPTDRIIIAHNIKALPVTPAKAGVQGNRQGLGALDSRFRGNDE